MSTYWIWTALHIPPAFCPSAPEVVQTTTEGHTPPRAPLDNTHTHSRGTEMVKHVTWKFTVCVGVYINYRWKVVPSGSSGFRTFSHSSCRIFRFSSSSDSDTNFLLRSTPPTFAILAPESSIHTSLVKGVLCNLGDFHLSVQISTWKPENDRGTEKLTSINEYGNTPFSGKDVHVQIRHFNNVNHTRIP